MGKRTVIGTVIGLVVLIAGALGYNVWNRQREADEDAQLRRDQHERLLYPPDLKCPDDLRPPLQRAVNESALTDALVLVEGSTVTFDMNGSPCDEEVLNIGFHDWRVNRLLKRCAIKRLVCADREGRSVDITW